MIKPDDEWGPDPETLDAVRAVQDPTHSANRGAAMHLWRQAADNNFSPDVLHFLQAVAERIVHFDTCMNRDGAPHEITPDDVKNACGLYGPKRSRVEGAAMEHVRTLGMFKMLGEDGNPLRGKDGEEVSGPTPSAEAIAAVLKRHPAAAGVRDENILAAAKKAREATRKGPPKAKPKP